MQKSVLSVAVALILILMIVVTPAAASTGQVVVGTCPTGFVLHEFMDHTDHAAHIGLTVDLNKNGFICVKHLDNGQHVHMDDVVQQSSFLNFLQMIFNLFTR